jgi:tetratricopeptide (TPR) repeat protein
MSTMTTAEATPQSATKTETPDKPAEQQPQHNLYERQRTIFQSSLDADLESGLARYGFGFFHSLLPEDRFLLQDKLGMPCQDAADLYNLGNAHASREEYERAVEYWKKALKMDPSLHAATYNIALACERLGKTAEARKLYEAYIESLEDAEEKQRIEEHLTQL